MRNSKVSLRVVNQNPPMEPTMSRTMLVFAACIIAGPALAEAPVITCGQARAQVTAQGSALVRSSPNVFDRFVTDRSFCAATQIARAATIATADAAFCPVGYKCEEPNNSRISR